MKTQNTNRIRLGAFVLAGTTCLILGLYFIGSKKNIFHSTISVTANFRNVGGLMQGNNVRFNGINVGTVSRVFAIADTAIRVEFTIDKDVVGFISNSAKASIGTDGLLGNKLVNISPGIQGGPAISEGFLLRSVDPIQIDNELRTLTGTNSNLQHISEDLKTMTGRLSSENALWNLLADSVLGDNIRSAVVNIRITGRNAAVLTGDLSKIIGDIKEGKGSVGAILTDSSFSDRLNQTIVNIQAISDSVAYVSGDLRTISSNLRNGKGTLGTLLTDTTLVNNLNKSMENIRNASGGFNENMTALQSSWPFRKYYRKKKRESERARTGK